MAQRRIELRPRAQIAYSARDRVISAALRYDRGMSGELFAQFQRFVEFTGKDKLALLEARQRLRPFFESVVDEFYGTLLHDPEAQAILDAEIGRLERLRQNLRQWVDQLFCGEYDQAYFEQRSRIGRTHVRIELPQHLMFFGMSVIRRELVRVIIEARLPNAAVVISAVHKLLDLELAVMNDSYREDFVDRTQAVERLQFEQRLGESEHLATIGQVAASLAHEIKNPLAGISGAIQVLGSELGDEHPHKPIIEEALRQIDRLDAAVKDLLLYARPQNPTVARCDLSEIVAESMILLRQEPAFQNVRIRCEGLTERHWAIVDPSQVKQIITNILINAAHACEDDGDIDCALETDARVVRLRITDTGAGIRPEVLSRVFEPFFTTKARGTGLGLAICKRIIEAHQGVILIESRPSVGTRVTVEFPVVP
ncbi:MAG: hypothetical protein HS101_01695 [Planctomycetia bacterium]|nr:hypothetical protein [Planctomycetia bacterium]MCC7314097.1 hypothetical protein [Planctomycetota bacterium]OQZ06919.1 MAG: hypothetical protein B6D36_02610 [Planctomycetes bacterium UTPLA1]